MNELKDSVQNHSLYRDKVNVFHKFGFKERPMMGVVLKNASASRIQLSADDYAGILKSHVALAREKNKEGKLLEWIWEDFEHTTEKVIDEDLSAQVDGSTRMFSVANTPVVSGYNNTNLADNFRQIVVKLDGVLIHAEDLEGQTGTLLLPTAPASGSTLTVSYTYKTMADAGRYYVEIINPTQYVVHPLYQVKNEVVIEKTNRIEMSAALTHSSVVTTFLTLYHQKSKNFPKVFLIEGEDYTVDATGNLTFIYPSPLIGGDPNPEYTLRPFPANTTLYADYRWTGTTIGPRSIPEEFQYDNGAITGVSLCFSNQIIEGDRQVVIVYDQRESASQVYSGHWSMSFDVEVFARDPIQLPDLTDHLVDDMWSRKRNSLISEGLTIEELAPTGEVEEVYDENTGDLYYKNSISMTIMTEWKRFKPFLTEVMDFDMKLYQYTTVNKGYLTLSDGQVEIDMNIVPSNREFVVKYPKVGYPRYY